MIEKSDIESVNRYGGILNSLDESIKNDYDSRIDRDSIRAALIDSVSEIQLKFKDKLDEEIYEGEKLQKQVASLINKENEKIYKLNVELNKEQKKLDKLNRNPVKNAQKIEEIEQKMNGIKGNISMSQSNISEFENSVIKNNGIIESHVDFFNNANKRLNRVVDTANTKYAMDVHKYERNNVKYDSKKYEPEKPKNVEMTEYQKPGLWSRIKDAFSKRFGSKAVKAGLATAATTIAVTGGTQQGRVEEKENKTNEYGVVDYDTQEKDGYDEVIEEANKQVDETKQELNNSEKQVENNEFDLFGSVAESVEEKAENKDENANKDKSLTDLMKDFADGKISGDDLAFSAKVLKEKIGEDKFKEIISNEIKNGNISIDSLCDKGKESGYTVETLLGVTNEQMKEMGMHQDLIEERANTKEGNFELFDKFAEAVKEDNSNVKKEEFDYFAMVAEEEKPDTKSNNNLSEELKGETNSTEEIAQKIAEEAVKRVSAPEKEGKEKDYDELSM